MLGMATMTWEHRNAIRTIRAAISDSAGIGTEIGCAKNGTPSKRTELHRGAPWAPLAMFLFTTELALLNVSRAGNNAIFGDNSKFASSFWLTHSRYHGTSMDRAQRNRQSYQRSHSIARFENHSNDNGKRRPDPANRSYTMTLPASHGRHRSRINGDFRTLIEPLPLLPPRFFYVRSFSSLTVSARIAIPPETRAQSVDPRIYKSKNEAPVLCNQYAIDAMLRRKSECPPPSGDVEHRARSMSRPPNRNKNLLSPSREPSADGQRHSVSDQRSRYLAPPIIEYECANECAEVEAPVRKAKRRKGSHMPPSPRIMSPLGLAVYRQARLQHFDEDSIIIDDEWVEHASDSPVRPVPIWLCVFLVIGYIIGGAFYFSSTESWSFLDSAYFAFITLTTIVSGLHLFHFVVFWFASRALIASLCLAGLRRFRASARLQPNGARANAFRDQELQFHHPRDRPGAAHRRLLAVSAVRHLVAGDELQFGAGGGDRQCEKCGPSAGHSQRRRL